MNEERGMREIYLLCHFIYLNSVYFVAIFLKLFTLKYNRLKR
jgi:hypothetical protein